MTIGSSDFSAVRRTGFASVPADYSDKESVSKVDFLTPKAFQNSAQGNTLGLRRAFEPTLKALNNNRMHNPQVNEFLNSYRVINPFGIFDPKGITLS
jgi:hypothetical protein